VVLGEDVMPTTKKKLYRILPFLHTTQQIDLDYRFFLQVFIHHQPSSSRSRCVFAEVSVVQAHPDNPDQMVVTVGLFVAGSAFPSWAAAHLAQMVPGLTPSRFGGDGKSRYLVIDITRLVKEVKLFFFREVSSW